MDKLKEKLNNMRTEAETAHEQADKAEAELREYETLLTAKDAEILGLKNRTILLEGDLQRQSGRIEQVSQQKGFNTQKSKKQPEYFLQKINELESAIDKSEIELKDANEKIRQFEVVAEQYERRVNQLKTERRRYDDIYEEIGKKYLEVKAELENTLAQLESI